jgi:prepilin-type N-terminal cleavage/methylation domain-containing protein
MSTTRERAGRGGFTLLEIILVIAVIVVLIAIGVVGLSSMMESADKALAENQFRAGLAAARELAVQTPGSDAAALFTYEPGGRTSIIPCPSAGVLRVPVNNAPDRRWEVFVPVADVQPIQLPKGWMVRGYAPAGSLDRATGSGWYETNYANATGDVRALEGAAGDEKGNWVFPETGFYQGRSNAGATAPPDNELATQGPQRQSFIVRFRGGTGSVDLAQADECFVIDPVPSGSFDRASGTVTDWRPVVDPFSTHRIDLASDAAKFVRRILQTSQTGAGATTAAKLLGAMSSDSILCRPVTELALYREKSLVAGLKDGGVRVGGVNGVTGTLYGDPVTGVPAYPRIDRRLFDGNVIPANLPGDINRWITGGLDKFGVPGVKVTTDARIFAIDRYLGQGRKLGDEREVTP